jgi:hypothetical protein
MKAFLIILILVIIAGGVAFYFGWVQFQIPPGHYGVIFTKTSGYDEDVVTPGTFEWRWEALLPTNLKVHTFSLEPRMTDISLSGELPSADTYSADYENKPDFSYSIDLVASYRIKPDKLPTLVENQKIQPEEFDEYYTFVKEQIAGLSSSYFKNIISQGEAAQPGGYTIGTFREELLTHLTQNIPEIEFLMLRVSTFEVPDIELYQQAKRYYLDTMEIRHNVRSQQIQESTRKETAELQQIEIYREYGKLLSEYPILLKYLALQKNQIESPEELLQVDEEE